MSTLIVEVCDVEDVRPHPNADLVEIVEVKGWQCVVGVGQFKRGDKCVYFPPDSVVPDEVAERFGIAKYCSHLPKGIDGVRPPGMRIRAQRFRGEQSFGTVQKPDDQEWPLYSSVIEHYSVTKYEPPLRATDGDAAPPYPLFHTYTDIENIRNFPDILVEGEEVVITEKVHGHNCRVGLVIAPNDCTDSNNGWSGRAEFQYMCGSHGQRRKEFNEKGQRSKYWHALSEPVMHLLTEIADVDNNVIIFGELYGEGIQDLRYGMKGIGFRVFDIAVNGKYMNWEDQNDILEERPDIEIAPILYRGPFSTSIVQQLTDGPTTLCSSEMAGKFSGREGIVVRPVRERYSEKLPHFGRVILKSISIDYLSRKGGTEYH